MGPDATPPTIYVIDDDPSIATALGRLLRSHGLECVPYSSIAAFMRGAIAKENACVVVDIRLDKEDGLMLPRLLKDRGLRLPVLVLTAVDTKEARLESLRAGAAAFFRKPVDEQALVDAIRWALTQAR